MKRLQIAIDGPAASGKSTVARLVAARLGGYYINTGDMYRAVTWVAVECDLDIAGAPDTVAALLGTVALAYELRDGVPVLMLNGTPAPSAKLRSPEVARRVSLVARMPAVRTWLRERQRDTCRLGLIVMEGRDIGTVILPEARHKFFVTASPEVRARRRLGQPGEVGHGATVASVAAEIAERDRLDSSRRLAPLTPAADAVIVNTDGMTAEQVADLIVKRVRASD